MACSLGFHAITFERSTLWRVNSVKNRALAFLLLSGRSDPLCPPQMMSGQPTLEHLHIGFDYEVGLFRYEVGQFYYEVGLFRYEVGQFYDEVGLFRYEVGQFYDEVGLFRYEVGQFYDEVGLFRYEVGLLLVSSPDPFPYAHAREIIGGWRKSEGKGLANRVGLARQLECERGCK